jgi:ABC-type uncharacterized transport system auxiliary subunit
MDFEKIIKILFLSLSRERDTIVAIGELLLQNENFSLSKQEIRTMLKQHISDRLFTDLVKSKLVIASYEQYKLNEVLKKGQGIKIYYAVDKKRFEALKIFIKNYE